MKKATAIFLVFSIVFHSMVIIVLNTVEQFSAQYEMEKNIKAGKTKAAKFRFQLAEFRKMQIDKKEFRKEGQMYDILSLKYNGNEVIVAAYADDDESSLLEELEKLLSRHASHSKSVIKSAEPFPPFLTANLYAPENTNVQTGKFTTDLFISFPEGFFLIPCPPPLKG